MLPNHFVRSLEQRCNELVCPNCGGHHEVRLDYHHADVVVPHFKDDACAGFQPFVTTFLNKEITRFLNDPLPLLK